MSEITARPRSLRDKLAFCIRVLTGPPLMVAVLLLLLFRYRTDVFANGGQLAAAILFLGVLPAAAYPLSWLPGLREKGREFQRNLAFLTSFCGYGLGWLYGRFFTDQPLLILIFTVYLVSVLLLLAMNKGLRLRASGHACAVAGPLLIASFLFQWPAQLVCVLLFAASFWGSVAFRRHTVSEFLLGAAACLVAMVLSWLCCGCPAF